MSKWTAKRLTGARVIISPGNETEAWLVRTVGRHAELAGIGMPEVAVYDAPDVNAFATGMRRDKALVAVSTGLLRAMDRSEAEAVLGHEVSHVANGDMITLALIQGVVNTFVIVLSRVVGYMIDRAVFRTERGHGPAFYLTTIIAQLVFGILASVVVFWFSRQREFRADSGGARLAGREKMIAALVRLQRSVNQPHLPDQMKAFGISGGVGHGLRRLFMTHPPLEERIEALRRGTEWDRFVSPRMSRCGTEKPGMKQNLVRRLYDWVLHWAHTPYGTPALFVLALAESSFFPIPPDVLLIAMAVSVPARAFKYAFVCSLGSVIGGTIGYGIGYVLWYTSDGGFSAFARFFFDYIPGFTQDVFNLVKGKYDENAFLAVFTAGFTPIPTRFLPLPAESAK